MSKDKYPVLVVDDFAFLRNSVCKIIEKMGCAADAVASGQEALNQLKDNSYALIFMDCRMPGMDGYEATRAVRGRQYADCRADFKSIG